MANASTVLGQYSVTIPSGTSAERPGTLTPGLFRFNTTTGCIEYTNNSNSWVGVGLFTASGGSESSIAGYKVHTYTSTGTFSTGVFSGAVEVLMVGAGGNGGYDVGGGGGGGGCLYTASVSMSPNTVYTVSIGSGVSGNSQGNPTTFAGLTAYGGGWGGNWQGNSGNPGGCGGGGSGFPGTSYNGAANGGNGTPGQGYPGGTGGGNYPSNGNGVGGGGGGGGQAGYPGQYAAQGGNVGKGGAGYTSSINGTSTTYGGGGGGSTDGGEYSAPGGAGGGGPGNANATYYGGGSGGSNANPSYSSYQGIVIIRYPA